MKKDISNYRTDYISGILEKEMLHDDPNEQFKLWFDHAVGANMPEPNAMTLSTVNLQGGASSRIVLLKEVNEDGYVFFTNYNSKKGDEMAQNNKVALCFFWLQMHRQVRIEGLVSKISKEESEKYFHSRPFGSQIGALASNQSSPSEGRKALEDKFDALYQLYEEAGKAPMPECWGGYVMRPTFFEFWQGRENRLHDRFEYQWDGATWNIVQLDP